MPDHDVEEGLDALFREPPERFVAARDALSRRLRSGGRAEVAAAVKQWRRPTRAVWALNTVALAGDETVSELVTAAADVAARQVDGSPGLRNAIGDLRRATHRAADAAIRVIGEARRSDRDEVTAALSALVGEPAALDELARGRLHAVPEVGLGAFGLAADDAPTAPAAPAARARSARAPKRDRRTKDDDREAARRRAAVDGARATLASAEEDLGRAAAEAEEADRLRTDAIREVAERRAELARAEGAMAAAEALVEDRRERYEDAEGAVREARDALARLVDGDPGP